MQPTSPNHFSRREFIGLAAGATAALMLPGSARAAFELPPPEFAEWQKTLRNSEPRRYLSAIHTDARMHLGGIATGNFEIGADGQFTSWQLWNNLREGQIPFYFAVKFGKTAKLLQTAGGPDWPRIAKIEMTGEYPRATLKFIDDSIPVQLELEAFSPWKPLDSDASSLPVAIFTFRAHNPTDQSQKISIASFFANTIGYCGIGDPLVGDGGNYNEIIHEPNASGFYLRAKGSPEPTLDKPVDIYVLKDWFRLPPDPEEGNTNYAYVAPHDIALPPLDRPEGLRVIVVDPTSFNSKDIEKPHQSVIWLEEAPADLSADFLKQVKAAVEVGAALVFSGTEFPLLAAYAAATNGKPVAEMKTREDILFDDFENGYGKWTIEGTAFGTKPTSGTLPGQQRVSGFNGKALVNSWVNGDDAKGKLTSQPFTIERAFIRFLISGGSRASTQIRLVIDGKTVRAASGKDNERLEGASWAVREFIGKSAHLEIIDDATGGWGHINIDDIVFSDSPSNTDAFVVLEELLPIRFSAVTPSRDGFVFENSEPLPGAHSDESGFGRLVLSEYQRDVGRGRVFLAETPIWVASKNYKAKVRTSAFATLCACVGSRYEVKAPLGRDPLLPQNPIFQDQNFSNGVAAERQSTLAPGFGAMSISILSDKAYGRQFIEWKLGLGMFADMPDQSNLSDADLPTPPISGESLFSFLASSITIAPGQTAEIPFILSWRFPNRYNAAGEQIGCDYATRWPDIETINKTAVANYKNYRDDLAIFQKAFYESSLPAWLLDCLTANAAIIRHVGVLFRLANRDVYAWEGSNGSCQPTCTHVWGYEQSLAHLFPDLERDMRRIDFTHQQEAGGGIHNRTDFPSPPHPTGERPFSDGHASCILKAYREALNSSDESFFNDYWPRVKLAVEYLIDRDAAASDGHPQGILQDEQWNTYDEATHGVTTFISGYYLAALRAGEEWAKRQNDNATADRYHQIFLAGQKKLVELCWNGEYFQQYLPDYMQRRGEVGPGCMSDQLIGQWWAHQLNLGYILPQEMVAGALRSIYKYNFKSDLTGWKHAPRSYAGANDKGLIVCTWPKGGRPETVLLYSDEVWTGLEYEVAALLIYEDMITEGLSVAKAARDRYDGVPRAPIQRNPWCEIECGGHYTRAMSSWSILLALSGAYHDGPKNLLRLEPFNPDNYKSFFTTATAFGSYAQTQRTATLAVSSGQLRLQTLQLPFHDFNLTVNLNNQPLAATVTQSGILTELHFNPPLQLSPGQTIQLGTSLD